MVDMEISRIQKLDEAVETLGRFFQQPYDIAKVEFYPYRLKHRTVRLFGFFQHLYWIPITYAVGILFTLTVTPSNSKEKTFLATVTLALANLMAALPLDDFRFATPENSRLQRNRSSLCKLFNHRWEGHRCFQPYICSCNRPAACWKYTCRLCQQWSHQRFWAIRRVNEADFYFIWEWNWGIDLLPKEKHLLCPLTEPLWQQCPNVPDPEPDVPEPVFILRVPSEEQLSMTARPLACATSSTTTVRWRTLTFKVPS